MSSTNFSGDKGSDVEDDNQLGGDSSVDAGEDEEDPFAEYVVDETPEFRASVDQEIHAKVETDHPDTMEGREDNEFSHLTLEKEEEIRGEQAELERISAKATFGRQDGREERTREVAVETQRESRAEMDARRVGSTKDPRPRLEQETLGAVNTQAARIAEQVQNAPSTAILGRELAERVADGAGITEAAFDTLEWAKGQPGVVVPIKDVPDVDAPLGEVDVDGEVIALWEPSGRGVSQVGLIADETEKIKFTTWNSSHQPTLRVGDEVRIRNAETDWWRGTCNLALTWRTEIRFKQGKDRPAPEMAEPSEPGGNAGPSPDVVSSAGESRTVSDPKPTGGNSRSLFAGGALIEAREAVASARTSLTVRVEQAVRPPLVVVEDDDLEVGSEDTEASQSQCQRRKARCPNCDEEVGVSVEIQQLRSADEAGTRLYRGTCGCTWRGED